MTRAVNEELDAQVRRALDRNEPLTPEAALAVEAMIRTAYAKLHETVPTPCLPACWTDLAARDPELYEVAALAKYVTEADEPLDALDMLEAAIAEWESVASNPARCTSCGGHGICSECCGFADAPCEACDSTGECTDCWPSAAVVASVRERDEPAVCGWPLNEWDRCTRPADHEGECA